MTTPPSDTAPDTAHRIALHCLALHRAALTHDRRARDAETALADWARAHALSLTAAYHTRHAHAAALRTHLRAAVRARHRRNQLLAPLAATRATTLIGLRAKLRAALCFIDDTPVAALLHSFARDLRRLR